MYLTLFTFLSLDISKFIFCFFFAFSLFVLYIVCFCSFKLSYTLNRSVLLSTYRRVYLFCTYICVCLLLPLLNRDQQGQNANKREFLSKFERIIFNIDFIRLFLNSIENKGGENSEGKATNI